MDRRLVSARWILLRSLLLLLVLLAAAVFVVLGLGARRTVQTVVRQFTSALADQTEARVRQFHRRVEAELETVAGWAANGTLRCADVECLAPLMRPVLERLPRVRALLTADDGGRSSMMMRQDDGWLLRSVEAGAPGENARLVRLDAAGARVRTWREALDYDARTRPWFKPATEAEAGVSWTAPYVFFTDGHAGVSASLRVTDPEGVPFVVAFDVLLDEITGYTASLKVGRRGFAVVTDERGRVLGLPREGAGAVLTPLAGVGHPAADALAAALGRRAGPARREPFAFESGGERWWGEWREIAVDRDTRVLVGIGVPLADFMGPAEETRRWVLGLTLLAILAAAYLALRFARRFARPLETLTAQSDRLTRLDTRPAPPSPTRIRELAHLGDAQDRVRQALDSFARYVPTEVVRDLLAQGQAARIGGREAVVTVLFTDIRGFTAVAEQLSPSDLVAHMSDYFEVVIDTLREAGATVDKIVGDAVVAFWGAPRANPDHARDAVRGVQRCRLALAALEARWRAEGRPVLPTRFGLATGPVVVGNVGAPSRLHYTVLGDTVNLASRLETANGRYDTDFLAAESTVTAAGGSWPWRRIDCIAVKGRRAETTIYTLDEDAEEDPGRSTSSPSKA